MGQKAYLVLEDGSYYEGLLCGAEIGTSGEAVFFQNLTSFNDVLTDPAAAGKIYAIDQLPQNEENEAQSDNLWASGLILPYTDEEINDYFDANGTPALVVENIDELCQKLRQKSQTAVIIKDLVEGQTIIKTTVKYDHIDFVKQVTTEEEYTLSPDGEPVAKVVLLDLGVRQDLVDKLLACDVQVTVVPASTSASDILTKKPDGLVVSGGPGNPERLRYVYDTLCQLVGSCPIFACALGCQMIAAAFSVKSYKMPLRHNGTADVRYKDRYETHLVTQNSSYAINCERIRYGLNIAACMADDDTVAALGHDMLPITGLDYYGEEDTSACSFNALLKGFVGSLKKN
ncbi:MAG: hypothetical protein FWF37_02710 [Chloroflexi bacterium]|nr:hypothetical protein [Chloroflexota bacterium]